MFKKILRAIRKDEGQGLAEYGLILSLIAASAVATLTALGTGINNTLTTVTGTL